MNDVYKFFLINRSCALLQIVKKISYGFLVFI
jgi:hypothetical protein